MKAIDTNIPESSLLAPSDGMAFQYGKSEGKNASYFQVDPSTRADESLIVCKECTPDRLKEAIATTKILNNSDLPASPDTLGNNL